MRGLAWGLLLVPLFNLSGEAAAQEPAKRPWRKVWVVSAVALAAATAFDASSSAGRFEANPLLRNSRGEFSASKGIAIKSLITGGTLAVQALLMRKRPDAGLEKACALVNFAAAGAVTGIAVRNGSVPAAAAATGQ